MIGLTLPQSKKITHPVSKARDGGWLINRRDEKFWKVNRLTGFGLAERSG